MLAPFCSSSLGKPVSLSKYPLTISRRCTWLEYQLHRIVDRIKWDDICNKHWKVVKWTEMIFYCCQWFRVNVNCALDVYLCDMKTENVKEIYTNYMFCLPLSSFSITEYFGLKGGFLSWRLILNPDMNHLSHNQVNYQGCCRSGVTQGSVIFSIVVLSLIIICSVFSHASWDKK